MNSDGLTVEDIFLRVTSWDLKQKELTWDIRDQAFAIRVDGKNFGKLSSFIFRKSKELKLYSNDDAEDPPLHYPFNPDFHRAMVVTMNRVMQRFRQCCFGMCHSDEITFIFPPTTGKTEHPYGGKVDKLVSLMAAYTTIEFRKAFEENLSYIDWDYDDNPLVFDARVILLHYLITPYVLFRSVIDCERNFVSQVARSRLGKKAIDGMKLRDVKHKLKEKCNWDISNVPLYWRRGTFSKYIKTIRTRGNGKEYTRHYLEQRTWDLSDMKDRLISEVDAMILAKVWPEELDDITSMVSFLTLEKDEVRVDAEG